MIVDPYLRAIVEKTGRREITSSMVARAEREREEDLPNFWYGLVEIQKEALQQSYYLHGSMAAQQDRSQGGLGSLTSAGLGSLLGGIFGHSGRCPYCGK